MRALIRLFCAVLHATCWVARSGATYLQQAAGGHFGNAKCPCIGLEMSGEVLVNVSQRNINYPASVGSRCKAWDHGLHPDCKKENSPAWCKSKWCYVDPCNCKIPLPPRKTLTSSKVRNKSLFWSYDTCGDTNTFFFSAASGQACAKQTTFNACVGVDDCLWDGEQCYSWERREIMKTCKQQDSPEDMYGKSTCKCIGPALRVGYVNLTLDSKGFFPYPASVGGECKAWDDGFHPDCRKRNSPDWCKSRWCYVDPCSCVLPDSLPKLSRSGAKFQGRPIYSSYSTCGGKDTFDKGNESLKFPPSFCAAEQLVVLKPGPAPAPVPAAVAAAAVATGAGVGSQTPSPDPDAAAAASAAAAAAALAPSSPSAANAAANAAAVAAAPADALAAASAGRVASVGSPDCPCIGIDFANFSGATPFTIRNLTVQYPVSTGSSCQAWDQGILPDCNAVAGPSTAPAWCNVSWCYVDPCRCNLAVPPSKTSFQYQWKGKPLYWSSSTCEEQNTSLAVDLVSLSGERSKACVHQDTQDLCLALDDCDWNGDRCMVREIAKECKKEAKIPEAVYGLRSCRCVGVGKHGWVNMAYGNTTVKYPASVGENCSAWDDGIYPDCKKKNSSDWCRQKWCYVDPCDCNLPDSYPKETSNGFLFSGNHVYWSYATCGGPDPYPDRLPKLSPFPPAFCSEACTRTPFVAVAMFVLPLLVYSY